jgi:hypothetical protein
MENLILNTPDQIELYRICVIKQSVKLESLGMKRHGRSATSIARGMLGLGRNAKHSIVLEKLNELIEQRTKLMEN